VWRRLYKRHAWDFVAPTFRSGCTSLVVWGALAGFDKCPLVVLPPNKRTAKKFVTIVYEAALSGFYFLHDHPQQLKLMEDDAP
jgi:hypothetical protein